MHRKTYENPVKENPDMAVKLDLITILVEDMARTSSTGTSATTTATRVSPPPAPTS
jgi:hypothetical protein